MIKLVVKAEVPEGGTKDFSYEFDQPVVTMGRLKENDIQLPVSTVSGSHAKILKEEDSYYLLDLGSINGTQLNNQRLAGGEKKLLNDGDIIKIQNFEIYFSSGITMMNVDAGATVQVARQMVMEVLGSWQSNVTEKPRIIIMGGPLNGKKFDLTENKPLLVGRVAENDIFIDHPSVSRKHAEISLTWSGAFIKDMKSANGVFVNDQRVVGSQKLRDRDEIRLGQQTSSAPVILVFSNPAEALLSKIDEMQSTEGTPAPVAPVSAAPVEAPPAPNAEPSSQAAAAAPETAEPLQPGEPEAFEGELPPEELDQDIYGPPEKKSMTVPLTMVGVAVVALIVAAVSFYYIWSGLESGNKLAFTAEPIKGSTGAVIVLRAPDMKPDKVTDVLLMNQSVHILSSADDGIRIMLPEIKTLTMPETKTEIVVQGKKGALGSAPFTVVLQPRIISISPRSGNVGSEVRVQTNIPAAQPTILFGASPAGFKSKSDKGLVVEVPKPADLIPAGGLKIPVTVKMNDTVSANSIDFIVLAAPVSAEDTFHLTFNARPYITPLGFNEYSIETNLGSLFVLTAKGSFGSSQERAEDAARNLNNAFDYFKNNSAAHVTSNKDGDHFVLNAEGAASGDKLPLFSVYDDDTIAYGKLSGHQVALEQLEEWWNMLLDAYFKVFVQVQNPVDTGIVASGGQVFEQIVSFYAIGNDTGNKFYKKDLVNILPPDQKMKLLSLSFALPERVLRADGKWSGAMANKLYPKLSVENLELVLLLRQSGESISGNATLNWKVMMGSGDNSFQNVAYRTLSTSPVHGTFRKTKVYPLEFYFVEKDGRRIDFVGKIEGGILYGKFSINSTGDEGNFNLQLQK